MNNSCYKILKVKEPVQDLFGRVKSDNLPFLLESSRNVSGMGRYSFFGSEPFLVFSAKSGVCAVEEDGRRVIYRQPPLTVLRELMERYHLNIGNKSQLPFMGGSVGFLGYDFGFSLEEIKRSNPPDPVVPDSMFAFYDTVFCFDHKKNELIICSSGFPEKKHLRAIRAKDCLKSALRKLETNVDKSTIVPFCDKKTRLHSNFSKNAYIAAIHRAKDYIACGDIYQVNLSQRFQTRREVDDWQLYRRLVKDFPVSFSGFFKTRDFSICSASPEKFINFDGKTVTTRPMKGTRPRTKNIAENRRLKDALVKSKKEKAELLMILDLERNDLGRVCDYGSIHVMAHRIIENYSNVFQATAEIRGSLYPGKDRIDLIRACFPGGSVTGCPKIRAMEVIEELEPDCRSIYTGSLGYLSFHNTMQLNVLIRSFLKKGDEIVFNVGGGIVADSKPEAEYEETLVKAKSLIEALG